ncbi:MAG: phage holin, LLH family [Chloroflexi bacterium]|nr:phage holin, LLH family [Chloroflexota bacterium]
MNILTPVLVTGLSAVLIAAVAYVIALLKDTVSVASLYLSAKIGASDYVFFRNIAKDVVLALMQHPAYKDLTGPEKKSLAILKITEYINKAGFNFTKDHIEEIIEAVYAEIKKDTA